VDDADYVVVGGGHNGLVCAAYLAQAGLSTIVVERAPELGGCTRTIDFPGAPRYRVNTCADVDIVFHTTPISQELQLSRFGFRTLEREAVFFAPFRDGRSLFIWRDLDRTAEGIRRFSEKDADAYVGYIRFWEEAFRRLTSIDEDPPPSPSKLGAALGGDVWAERFLQFLVTPPDELAKRLFESPQMQGILGWQAALYGAPPDQPGTAIGLGHLAMCVLNGITRPDGGMGTLCSALRACIEAHGGRTIVGDGARQVLLRKGTAVGIRTDSGVEVIARHGVVASIDAWRVFRQLVPPGTLPTEVEREVDGISVNNVGLMRVSLALRGEPQFDDRFGSGSAFLRDSLQASLILNADSWDAIQQPWNVVREGDIPLTGNNMWIGIPTAMDSAAAPPGHHVISFLNYVPFRLARGTWTERSQESVDAVLRTWGSYSSITASLIDAMWVQTPDDLHAETGNIHSNAFHIDQAFHQMFGMRPTVSLSQYTTPVEKLYLTGSGVHPGGGVTGLPGRNTARRILAGESVALSHLNASMEHQEAP
jgi:beta-carotene ketolase (CrtO type)